jgi:hypothetical protein
MVEQGALRQTPVLTVSAKLLHSFDGGPIVIDVTLRNDGHWVIPIVRSSRHSYVSIDIPSGWEVRSASGLRDAGGVFGINPLAKGEEISERVYVHHRYSRIGAGKAKLKITWHVCAADDPNDPSTASEIASPSAVLDLEVKGATDKQLTALMEPLIRPMEAPSHHKDELALTVLWCEHKAFLPAIFQLLTPGYRGPPSINLRHFVYEWSRKDKEIHDRLIEHLYLHGFRLDSVFFDRWREDGVVLTKEEIVSLLSSDNIWIRAWTYRNWPEQCEALSPDNRGEERKQELLEELEQIRREIESAGEGEKKRGATKPDSRQFMVALIGLSGACIVLGSFVVVAYRRKTGFVRNRTGQLEPP